MYGLTRGTYWFLYTAGPAAVASAERGSGYTPYGREVSPYSADPAPTPSACSGRVVKPMNFHQFTTNRSHQAVTFLCEGYSEESGDAFGACPATTPGVVPVYGWTGPPSERRRTPPASPR